MCGFEFEEACCFLTNRWLNWVRVALEFWQHFALEFLPNLWYLPIRENQQQKFYDQRKESCCIPHRQVEKSMSWRVENLLCLY